MYVKGLQLNAVSRHRVGYTELITCNMKSLQHALGRMSNALLTSHSGLIEHFCSHKHTGSTAYGTYC